MNTTSDPLPENPSAAPAAAEARPPRRPRYSGRNPRRFEEKYKEHDPTRYPDDVAKVLAAGKTPAGTHRPVCVNEVLELLAPQPGELAVDATLGYGGHARELLARLQPGGRLLGLDLDPIELPRTESRLRAAGFGPETFTARQSNYAGLLRLLPEFAPDGVDLLLADLGCSSMQLDDPARGFTYKHDGPLDLRMNPRRDPCAAVLLERMEAPGLERMLTDHAEEPEAAVLARAIVGARRSAPLRSTGDLARVVREAVNGLPQPPDRETADRILARVFQALRIEVNDEFSALDTFLRTLPQCLRPGGRVVILTFHSGEDRRVKKAFQTGARDGVYSQVAREVVRPTPEEVRSNPRAGCAKLRWAVRSESPL